MPLNELVSRVKQKAQVEELRQTINVYLRTMWLPKLDFQYFPIYQLRFPCKHKKVQRWGPLDLLMHKYRKI